MNSSFLKDLAEYIVELSKNKTYEIDGETYSDKPLHRIEPYVPRPETLIVTGLDSIVELVQAEMERFNLPVFVSIEGPREVAVITTLDHDMNRDIPFRAVCDVPGFCEGFREYDEALIELRSKFIPGEDVDYILSLISRINRENGVTTMDNGVSQSVEARTGISLKQMVNVRPRVKLAPYRTFLEVPQPESEFILRLNEDGEVGLFEADGGMWKMEAKKNIYDYFRNAFPTEIIAGGVIVMM